MADNYLEKKFEQLRSGRPVYRTVNPSLDSLLAELSRQPHADDIMRQESGGTHGSGADAVKLAQLEAVARSAVRSCPDAVKAKCSEAEAGISLSAPDMFVLGAAVLAARLKACELHLRSECVCKDGAHGDRPACAVLKLSK